MAQGFDRFRLTGSGRTEGRATQSRLERLGHRQITAIRQRRLDQSILDAQVFESVLEAGVGHVDRQLFERIRLLGIEVEAHLTEPFERFGVRHFRLDQIARHRALVHELVDEVLQLPSSQHRLFLQHRIGQHIQRRLHLTCNDRNSSCPYNSTISLKIQH